MQFTSDNSSLIDKVTEALAYDAPCPNETLTADWDVIQETKSTMQQFANQPSLSWVKGHQDATKECDELSLEAQLNVDADQLAGQHAAQWPICRPAAPRLESNTAQLHIRGKTITSHYAQEIRRAAHHDTSRQHIVLKNDWSQATEQLVDWDLHASALKRNKHRRAFLVKLCHNVLPFGAITKHHDNQTTSKCAFCGADPDDLRHLLQCKNETIKEWRKTFRRDFRVHASHISTRPGLLDTIMTGLESMFDENAEDVDSERCQQVCEEQEQIGWMNLIQGRWSKHWSFLQDECLSFQGIKTTSNNGQTWALRITSKLWDFIHGLWTQRNAALHGDNETSQETERKARAMKIIRDMQDMKNKMLNSDHVYLIQDLAAWAKDKTSANLFNWINTWQPLCNASALAAEDLGLQNAGTITSCFLQINPTESTRPPKARHSRKHGRQRNPHRKSRKRRRIQPVGMSTIPHLFFGHST